jgi:hypothetical protein
VPRTGDNYDHSEFVKLECDHLFVDIKDLRLAFEQFRRDTAIGFVSHDILDLHMINMKAQMETLEQKFNDLREDIRMSEQKSIGNVERIWMRLGTTGGIIGVVIALLELLQRIR